jgi:lysophospholipase L1-like esterase
MRATPRLLIALAIGFMLGGIEAPAAEPDSPPLPAYALAIPAVDNDLPGKGPLRRHTWFQNLWLERRTAWAEQVDQDQGSLVFFGDSITQGWGDDLGGAFPEAKVANRGISGDTSRGLLLRLQEDVLALNPVGIVLLIGTNDIEDAARPDAIVGNVVLLVEQISAHDPDIPILLCEVFPSSPTKDRGPELIRDLNDRYRAAFADHAHVTLVATWGPYAKPDGNARLRDMPDLLHPNAAGYDIWQAALRPALQAKGLLPATVPPSTSSPAS